MKKRIFLIIQMLLLSGWMVNIINAQVNNSPVLDGILDQQWNLTEWRYPSKIVKNTNNTSFTSDRDFKSSFKILWDKEALYLFILVIDDDLVNIGSITHQNDNCEIYFDINNSKTSTYDGIDDDQIRIEYGRLDGYESKRKAENIEFVQISSDTSWIIEAKFPWVNLTSNTFDAAVNDIIGFDLFTTDNDGNDNLKDHILAWNSPTNDAWQNPLLFGNLKLLADGTLDSVETSATEIDHDNLDIDESKIQYVIYVDNQNNAASDSVTGLDPYKPLSTITKALANSEEYLGAGLGVKIAISPGIYRESGLTVKPKGNGNKFLNTELVIEGTHPDSVIITGADLWNEGWERLSNKRWRHQWDYSFTKLNAWGGLLSELGTKREMIFVDDLWMRQVLSIDDLGDNTFYVHDNNYIYVEVADSINFENSNKEVSFRGDGINAPWPPQRLFSVPTEKDKVVLRNLTFRYANMRMQNAGQVYINNWKTIIDNCVVEWSNGFGLQIVEAKKIKLISSKFLNNGGAGVMTNYVEELEIQDCVSSYNNWRGDLGNLHSWAIGGIKFHHTSNTSVSNFILESNKCPGLWTDLLCEDMVFDNLTLKSNWGPGLLPEISRNLEIKNSSIIRNSEGIRIHSSHDVIVNNCNILGNGIQFSLYYDHRNFEDISWQNQLGMIWSKEPTNWYINNSRIEAEDNSQLQAELEKWIPNWLQYSNHGFQPFFHFNKPAGYLSFFANSTIDNNIWVHPATDKPFFDENGNPLTFEEWKQYIAELITSVDRNEEEDIGLNISNYPNPFNSTTQFNYTLNMPQKVNLDIYSVTGEKVKTLVSDFKFPGKYNVLWNGKNELDNIVSSGIYIYSLSAGEKRISRKCLLIK